MTDAHLHLMLIHFPVVGTLAAFLLLLSGLIFKSRPLQMAGLVALVLAGITAYASNATGEGAEEVLEAIPGRFDELAHRLTHDHEEVAEKVTPALIVQAVLALVGMFLVWKQTRYGRIAVLVLCITSAVSFGGVSYVANLGGQISHPEIREASIAPATPAPAGEPAAGENTEAEHAHAEEH